MKEFLFKIDEHLLYKVKYDIDDIWLHFKIEFIEVYDDDIKEIEETRMFCKGYLKDQGDTIIIEKFTDYISDARCFSDLEVVFESLKEKL